MLVVIEAMDGEYDDDDDDDDEIDEVLLHFTFVSQDKKKKYEPPVPTRVGKKKKKMKGPEAANKLPLGKYLEPASEIFSQNLPCYF